MSNRTSGGLRSAKEQIEVASEVLARVENLDPEWEAAWLEELERRSAKLNTDPHSAASWPEVRGEILRGMSNS
jgi:hypothetical protein